jgi:hypothetical protein
MYAVTEKVADERVGMDPLKAKPCKCGNPRAVIRTTGVLAPYCEVCRREVNKGYKKNAKQKPTP